MQTYYADLHVHIGRSSNGQPVKIAASPRLTLPGIIDECVTRKGLGMVGIIDAVCTPVFHDFQEHLEQGKLTELEGGGLASSDRRLTILLGAELEVSTGGKAAHYLAYFPNLTCVSQFRTMVQPFITNLSLSSQVVRISPGELVQAVQASDGLFMLAHAFTPHKGYFGNCADRLSAFFSEPEVDQIAAVELGLSSDTAMAGRIQELNPIPFVSNSDAHSLENIAREYNAFKLAAPTFHEIRLALSKSQGRQIVASYGLDPRLGKYHRTFCPRCEEQVSLRPDRRCQQCDGPVVVGVYDRLSEIADLKHPMSGRPPYIHQVPLRFIPGLGPAGIKKLLDRFGTHMHILHHATYAEVAEVVGEKMASRIEDARSGRASIQQGAGGYYGKIDG